MSEAGERHRSGWVSDYDYTARRLVLTRTSGPEFRHWWSPIRLSPTLSDPDGAFQVYVVSDPETPTSEPEALRVNAALDFDGDLIAPHIDLNLDLVGSRTIWPSRRTVGLAAGYSRFLWWSEGPLWTSTPPRQWELMNRDDDGEWIQGRLS